MANVPPFRLGGEIDPNVWHFSRLGEAGPLPNPVGHTFPLLTHDEGQRWRLIGTGFYINDGGFFATARHVIEDVLKNGRQISPLVIMHLRSESGLFGPSDFQLRPIMQCWLGDPADVALGAAATATNRVTGEVMKNWTWTLLVGSAQRSSRRHLRVPEPRRRGRWPAHPFCTWRVWGTCAGFGRFPG